MMCCAVLCPAVLCYAVFMQAKPGVKLHLLGETVDGHDLDLLQVGLVHLHGPVRPAQHCTLSMRWHWQLCASCVCQMYCMFVFSAAYQCTLPVHLGIHAPGSLGVLIATHPATQPARQADRQVGSQPASLLGTSAGLVCASRYAVPRVILAGCMNACKLTSAEQRAGLCHRWNKGKHDQMNIDRWAASLPPQWLVLYCCC